MSDSQALALLALRRLHSRMGMVAPVVTHNGDVHEPGPSDLTTLTAGDRTALGRVLRRAVERTWLTVETLFARDAVAARLGRGAQALASVFDNSCFRQLASTPAPFRPTIWRQLHAARKAGPLSHGEVEVEDLLRQISALAPPGSPQALQDLEWYALWQLAADLARDGYPDLRSLFEARSTGGESLLVGLVTSFIPFELGLEGNPPRSDLGLCLVPDEHIRWLCEHSEPVEVLLNEEYGGGSRSVPTEVTARIRQGQAYAQQGEYERAAIEFTAAIQADLTAAAPFVHRGDALRLRGEYDRAIADYTQALRLDSNNLLARLNRGLVYRLTGRAELAITDLTEALRLDSRNVVALNGRGSAHADLGRYDLAIADHTEALRLDPALAWAHQSRGDAYAGRAEYDRAIADYTQALRLNPHFALAHANRGNAYRLSGNLDRAAADYTEALRLDPLNPRMFTSRGDTYRRQARFDLALADYGEAIRLDPTNPAGYLNRGITYQQAGNYDRAVADFDRAEQFDSANPEVFYRRALAHQHQRSYEHALADLNRVIELNPRDAVAHVSRGTLHSLKRQFSKAIDDFTEAIRLDPTSAQAYLERGRVQTLLGSFDDALADSAEALRLNPHLVPALLVRGGVRIRAGDFEAAVEELDQAIQINPRYARAYNDRGVAYSKLGRLDDAVRDFTRAIELVPEYAPAHSNRANAYQLQQRHDLALADLTRAVVIDAKYAVGYCLQRSQVEAGRNNFRQALADLAVALAVDPKNRAARLAQTDIRQKQQTDFEVAPVADHTAAHAVAEMTLPAIQVPATATVERAVATPTQVIDLTDAIDNDGTPSSPSAESPPTELAIPSAAVPAGAPETEYEAEQRRTREQEQQARLRALAEKAEEIRRRNELEEAKRKAEAEKQKKKRGRVRRDPDEVRQVWQKRKQYGFFIAASLVLLYYLIPFVIGLFPPAPPKQVTAEKLVEAYVKNPESANDRYADKPLTVVGKVKIDGPKLWRRTSELKVFFDVGGSDKVVIQCVMHDDEDILGLKTDRTYRATGTVDKFVPGRPLVLKDCFLYEERSSAAAAPQGGVPARADAGPGIARSAAGRAERLFEVSRETHGYFRRGRYSHAGSLL